MATLNIPMAQEKRVVIKLGSAMVTQAHKNKADAQFLTRLAAGVGALINQGTQVLIVSSGAIALGRDSLGPARPIKLEQKQAAAAIGQVRLMAAFGDAFRSHGLELAQCLLTLEDTEARRRWLNARNTLETLVESRVIPIINENDTIATDEIRYGDNDRLAARTAAMMGADTLYLVSDVDGLYTGDPHADASAAHVPYVDALNDEILAMAGAQTSDISSGGMKTKLLAAEIAYHAGCATIICDGTRPFLWLDKSVRHTRIQPQTSVEAARKVWLRGHLVPKGKLIIDSGAVTALRSGASLLPVGVVGHEGIFGRGDAVGILDSEQMLVAKGIVNYPSEHIPHIAGRRSEDLASDTSMNFTRKTLVHRDDLVMI